MSDPLFPANTAALAKRRKALTPEAEKAFIAFSQAVFADGALDAKTKQLIAVAVAHVTHIASRATPRRRCATRQARLKSWKRSGSPQRCVPEELMRIRRSPWRHLTGNILNRSRQDKPESHGLISQRFSSGSY